MATPYAATAADAESGPRRSLGRTSFGVSILAGAALVAGFAVDAVIAALFGAGSNTDAFFVAATLPFAIAAVLVALANQALAPLFVRWYREGDEAASGTVGGMIGALLVIATGIFALGVAVSPWIPRIIAPGASEATHQLAAELSVILFATVVTRTAAESLRALLNARFSFAAPAASPMLISGGAMLATFLLQGGIGIRALAYGYLLGGILQVLFLGATAMRKQVPVRLGLGFDNRDVRAGLRLLGWPTASTSLNLVARVAERFIASFLGEGAITLVNYAWRIINAIGGTVFFRSVTVVLIPSLAGRQERDDQIATVLTGLRIMLTVAVPVAVFMALFADDIVRVVFERGAFTNESAATLARVLIIYAIGLPFIALTRVLLSTFYARLDMKRPFFNRVILTIIDVIAAVALAIPFGLAGVALGYVVAVVAAFGHAVYLVKPLHIPWRRTVSPAATVAAAAVAGGAFALIVSAIIPNGSATLAVALTLATATGLGLAAYAVLLLTVGRARYGMEEPVR